MRCRTVSASELWLAGRTCSRGGMVGQSKEEVAVFPSRFLIPENRYRMKTNFKVHLVDGSHHNLKDLDYTLIYHTCMGFVKKDGRPVSCFFNNVFGTGSPMTRGFLETSLSGGFMNNPVQELWI